MLRLQCVLGLIIFAGACATAELHAPLVAPAPEPPPAPAEPRPENSDVPKTDGRDLIETAAQRYAREYGSCDFRDAAVPSPLDQVSEELRIVVDLRDPRALRSTAGWTRRNAPRPLAALVKRLAKRDAELSACIAGLPAPTTPINAGSAVALRLLPQAGPSPLKVELDRAPDTPVTHCLAERLGVLLRDVRIDQTLLLSFIVPDAVFPPKLVSSPALDKEVIRRVIARNIVDVRKCYEAAMQVWPEIAGEVSVRFAISSNEGLVLDARVAANSTGQPALGCCIARTVYGWRFPGNGSKGFTVVTYPFLFERVTTDEEP
jgi:hypothetical protein